MPTSGSRYRWRLGEMEIARVLEFEAALFEPAVLYPDVTPETIERHRSWLEPTLMDPVSGLMAFAFHSTVIKTPHATILVDTCSGNHKERPQKPRYHRKNWPYLANLAAAGFAPEDIDYVLCTHLHADHVGWNTRLLDGRWVPTFPNARYLFARQEWEHWQNGELRARYTTDPYYEDSLLPVMESGQAQLVASDYAFDDSVWIEPWPGHTPGHVCVVARSPRASVILERRYHAYGASVRRAASQQLLLRRCGGCAGNTPTLSGDFRGQPRNGHPQPFSDPDRRLDSLT